MPFGIQLLHEREEKYEKNVRLFVFLMLLLLPLSACGAKKEVSPAPEEAYPRAYAEGQVSKRRTDSGNFSVSTTESKQLVDGELWSSKETAIIYPVKVYSEGYEIVVRLAIDEEDQKYTLSAGDEEILHIEGGGYLYVIVN